MTDISLLKHESDRYRELHEEMVRLYEGRVIVMKNGVVIGDYADERSAVIETRKTHPMGTFLVQRVSRDYATPSMTLHSRSLAPSQPHAGSE